MSWMGWCTYDFFQDVDLVEKHALLVIVHVALAQHFHRTLGARLSVHAHAHFSEGAYQIRQKRS